jgi:DNA-directed RNA polymerase subunit beta'
MVFGSFEEAKLAYELGVVDFRAEIDVRDTSHDGERMKTSVGRIIFNEVLPDEMVFYNRVIDKTGLKEVVTACSKVLDDEDMAVVLDNLKKLGFDYATKSGTTVAMNDIQVPGTKPELIAEAE